MDIQRSQQLKDIIVMSKQMLTLAKNREWEQVTELEEKRRVLVLQCFQQPTSEQDSPEVAASIREVLRLNQEVTELGKQSREELGGELRTNITGRTAQAAYQAYSR